MAKLTVIEHGDDLTHIALSGRLDVQGVQKVELKFTSHTAARKRPAIVDFAEIEFIASLGIAMLLGTARALRGHGASMVLISTKGRVDEVLREAGIDKVIPFAASREEAIELLGASYSSE
jgi:anti-anti-sigma factor